MTNPILSVIIPVFNESKRLYHLDEINTFLKKQKYSTELILVNDGSTDSTLNLLKKMQKKINFKIISYSINRGKGYALKTGMLKASGKYRLFTDVDLSTPIEEVNKFLPFLKKYNLVIGTRKLKNSQLIKRQPLLRESMGKFFTFLSQKILGVKVTDFTCGFKCFSNSSANEIFSSITIDRWGFDSEVLFIATIKNYKIKEISVPWKNDPNSKVKFPEDIYRSLTDLLKIKLNSLRNIY